MGKFSSIFGSKPKPQPAIVLPPAAPSAAASSERSNTEADAAASRLRIAEKRKRGRRASILSDVGEEEAKLATVSRPQAGRAASVLFGG